MNPVRNKGMVALFITALIILSGCSGTGTSDCLCDIDPDSGEDTDALDNGDSDGEDDGDEGPSCPEPIAPSCAEDPE